MRVAAPIPRIEALTTKNWSVAYSAQPNATRLWFYANSGSPTVIYSATVVGSDATHFNAYYTVGDSAGMVVMGEWCASFTAGPVFHRQLAHIVKTRT